MITLLFNLIFLLQPVDNIQSTINYDICSLRDVICEGQEQIATPLEYQTAIASYYTVASSSSLTASGEEFRDDLYTVAHKTLPFGTRLEICHDGCVEVRVNDRGPFIDGREFDVTTRVKNAIGCSDICEIKWIKL